MLVAGIAANLAVIIMFAMWKEDPGLIASWEPYTSQAAGFSLVYPQGWRVKEFDRHSTEFETKFQKSRDIYISVIASLGGGLVMDILKSAHVPQQRPLKTCHNMLLDGMKATFGNFKELETTRTTVAGTEGYCTSFEFITWNGLMRRSMKGMVVSTWNGDNQVSLQLVCPIKKYHKMLPVFNTFVQGFRPKKT